MGNDSKESITLFRLEDSAGLKKKRWRHIRELIALLVILAFILGLLRFGYHRYMCAAYPLEYSEYVLNYAEMYDFEPSLIFALIYTESGFNPDAVSSADAIGLMQITEDTFEWAQNRTNVEELIPTNELFDPEVNIHYGVLVMSLLREQFSDTNTMLAAYNAGIGNVRRWLENTDYSDDGIILKEIPFEETENYIEKIPEAKKMYEQLYDL